ncbi:MAG TPA: contact-dependent growth inhibition system immunity protein [Labilithrix sp.]|nr:contact-dependent growth inhibition system immunity protein [Labilithrix sp.]
MIARNEYPKLRNFIACSFHPDWDETAATYQGVVDVDLAGESPVYLRQIAAEIATLLASPVTNEELAKWLELIGCYVILEAEGYTARSFITMIGDRLRTIGTVAPS